MKNAIPARPPALPSRTPRDIARPDRAASRDFPPDPEAASAVRRLTRRTLARWGLAALIDDAEAIASELAANAATAAEATGYPVIFSIHDRPPELRIYLWDRGPGNPPDEPPAVPDYAERGRGLVVVDALSSSWGWYPTPLSGGKVVWASLAAPAS